MKLASLALFALALGGCDRPLYLDDGTDGGGGDATQSVVQCTTIAAPVTMPVPVFDNGVTLGADGRIYSLGGASQFSSPNDDRSWAYDAVAGAWTELPRRPGGTGPAQAAAITVGSTLYAIDDNVTTYDTASARWSTHGKLPGGRYDPAATLGADGRIYATNAMIVPSTIVYDVAHDT